MHINTCKRIFIMKKFFLKYYHALPLIIYGIIYMSWFNHLERLTGRNYTVIHMAIDDKIPFCEIFIIPYFLWFAYIAWIVVYLFFKNKEDYYRSCTFLFTWMTVFLLVSTFFPNIHYLRPIYMTRTNIFTELVSYLYSIDTSTNLWPSIHVYNSLGVFFAVMHNKHLSSKKSVKWGSFILSTLIILSTMFLKQHSMFDVMTAFIMAAVVYTLVYRYDVIMSIRQSYITSRKKRKSRNYVSFKFR